MTTLYIVSDNGDLDNGFASFLASYVEDTLGEVEVKVVPSASYLITAENRAIVNEAWDSWCARSQAERDEWAD